VANAETSIDVSGAHRARAKPAPRDSNGFLCAQAQRLCASYRHWTGRRLLDADVPAEEVGRALYDAPMVVAAHGTGADPLFNYANCMALALWECTWQAFTAMPSRLSAEPLVQAERRRFLARVAAHGFIEDYAGVRISTRGRRFRIRAATVWNVVDARGALHGQAVVFRHWEFL
jgi:hypothetical protein